MGRRVKKTVYAYGSGGWELQKEILFVYDSWNLIHEKEVSATGDPVFDKFYVWGLDLSQTIQGAGGIGGLVCRISGGEVRHYFYDANGNVGQMVDPADGVVTARYEYDPFGKAIVEDGAEAEGNAFRFSTKYWDEETRLVYYGFRYYSAELGRWINKDPAEEDGGINLYLLIFNNSINNIDPLGLESFAPVGDTALYIAKLQIDYLREKLENVSPKGGCSTIFLALSATVLEVASGVVNSPEDTVNQIVTFANNPGKNTIPILGPMGEAIGISWAVAVENQDLESYSVAIGHTLFGLNVAIGGAQVSRSIALKKPSSSFNPEDWADQVVRRWEDTVQRYGFTDEWYSSYGMAPKNLSRTQRNHIKILREGGEVQVQTVEEARALLDHMPELRPATQNRLIPNPTGKMRDGFKDPKGTYRGDLINKTDPTKPVHPDVQNALHRDNPHYNIKLPNGDKSAIIIMGE